MKKIIIVAVVIAAVTGCATIDMDYINEQQDSTRIEPLRLEHNIELTHLRIDIDRQTRTETTTNSDGTTSSTQVPVEYSPIGISLGNGLYLDASYNLAVSIPEHFGIDGEYSIERLDKGMFGSVRITYIKSENLLECKSHVLFGQAREYTIGDSEITEKYSGPFGAENTIEIDSDVLRYKSPVFLGIQSTQEIIQKSDTEMAIPHLFGQAKIKQLSPDKISIDEHTTVTIVDGTVVVEKHSIFGSFVAGTYVPLKNGFAVYDAAKMGFVVERFGDVIEINSNGTLISELHIQ